MIGLIIAFAAGFVAGVGVFWLAYCSSIGIAQDAKGHDDPWGTS